jgi:mannose-6-phosphate isomerase-like protein (cupin superfamily)
MTQEIQKQEDIVISKVSAYEEYTQEEGIPKISGFYIEDLKTVEVGPWARLGVNGTWIDLIGTGGTNDGAIVELPGGKSTTPQHHLFEAMVYVVSGNGATEVWYDEGKKLSFEWNTGSVFAIPLNAWYTFHNGRGNQPARLYVVTNAPIIMNLYHNREFVFNTPFAFKDRFAGEDNYFSDAGKLYKNRVLETNFVPDTHNMELYSWAARGANGRNVMFELAHNTMAAHVSEFPVSTYKKAHRHGPGAHVIIIGGVGYSLLWQAGDEENMKKVDWKLGSVVVPPDQWFHQHFNSGTEPARYLALRWGSQRYSTGGVFSSDALKADVSVKLGGYQIEYEDESPYIHDTFESELAKHGGHSEMVPMLEEAKAKARAREAAGAA